MADYLKWLNSVQVDREEEAAPAEPEKPTDDVYEWLKTAESEPVRMKTVDDREAYLDGWSGAPTKKQVPDVEIGSLQEAVAMVLGGYRSGPPGADAAQYVGERLPFIGGAITAADVTRTIGALNRVKDGKHSQDDLLTVAEALVQPVTEQNKSFMRKVFDLASSIPGFATEFAATGGTYTAWKKAATELGEAALKRVIQNQGAKAVAKHGAGRAALGAAQAVLPRAAGVAAQTAMNPQLMASSIARQFQPMYGLQESDAKGIELALDYGDDGTLERIAKGLGSAAIEIGSERAGKLLEGGKVEAAVTGLKTMLIGRALGRGRTAKAIGDALQQGGWNGMIGEMYEEWLGELARGATGIEDFPDYLSKEYAKQQGVMAAAFAIPGAVGTGAQVAETLQDRHFRSQRDTAHKTAEAGGLHGEEALFVSNLLQRGQIKDVAEYKQRKEDFDAEMEHAIQTHRIAVKAALGAGFTDEEAQDIASQILAGEVKLEDFLAAAREKRHAEREAEQAVETGTDAPSDVAAGEVAPEVEAETEAETVEEQPSDGPVDLRYTREGPVGAFLDGWERIGEGSESVVYRKDGVVVKVSEPYSDKSEETYTARVNAALLVDRLIGDGTLRVIGHYLSQNGTKNPIFSQPFVEGRAATREEIRKYMEGRGFAVQEEGTTTDTFVRTEDGQSHIARDMDGDNVRVDAAGNIRVIDGSIEVVRQEAKPLETPVEKTEPTPSEPAAETSLEVPPTESDNPASRLDELRRRKEAEGSGPAPEVNIPADAETEFELPRGTRRDMPIVVKTAAGESNMTAGDAVDRLNELGGLRRRDTVTPDEIAAINEESQAIREAIWAAREGTRKPKMPEPTEPVVEEATPPPNWPAPLDSRSRELRDRAVAAGVRVEKGAYPGEYVVVSPAGTRHNVSGGPNVYAEAERVLRTAKPKEDAKNATGTSVEDGVGEGAAEDARTDAGVHGSGTDSAGVATGAITVADGGVGGYAEEDLRAMPPAAVEALWRSKVPAAAGVKFAPSKSEMVRQILAGDEGEDVTEESSQEPVAEDDARRADEPGDDLPPDDMLGDEPGFNPEQAIKIAADSIEQLRRQDVFRVLDSVDPDDRDAVAEYILSNRGDLSAEVEEALGDLEQETPAEPEGTSEMDAYSSPEAFDLAKAKFQNDLQLKREATAPDGSIIKIVSAGEGYAVEYRKDGVIVTEGNPRSPWSIHEARERALQDAGLADQYRPKPKIPGAEDATITLEEIKPTATNPDRYKSVMTTNKGGRLAVSATGKTPAEARERAERQFSERLAERDKAAKPEKPSAVVDTIAGRMSLDEFEAKGYAPEQVTKADWVNLQRAARRAMGQSEEADTRHAPYAEHEEFHRQAVKAAVARGDEVDPEVLKDYPDLQPKPEVKPFSAKQRSKIASVIPAAYNPVGEIEHTTEDPHIYTARVKWTIGSNEYSAEADSRGDEGKGTPTQAFSRLMARLPGEYQKSVDAESLLDEGELPEWKQSIAGAVSASGIRPIHFADLFTIAKRVKSDLAPAEFRRAMIQMANAGMVTLESYTQSKAEARRPELAIAISGENMLYASRPTGKRASYDEAWADVDPWDVTVPAYKRTLENAKRRPNAESSEAEVETVPYPESGPVIEQWFGEDKAREMVWTKTVTPSRSIKVGEYAAVYDEAGIRVAAGIVRSASNTFVDIESDGKLMVYFYADPKHKYRFAVGMARQKKEPESTPIEQMTDEEAIEAGISYQDWAAAVDDAFRNDRIPEAADSWKSRATAEPDDFAGVKWIGKKVAVLGPHGHFFGTVESAVPRGALVRLADGESYKQSADILAPLEDWVANRRKNGKRVPAEAEAVLAEGAKKGPTKLFHAGPAGITSFHKNTYFGLSADDVHGHANAEHVYEVLADVQNTLVLPAGTIAQSDIDNAGIDYQLPEEISIDLVGYDDGLVSAIRAAGYDSVRTPDNERYVSQFIVFDPARLRIVSPSAAEPLPWIGADIADESRWYGTRVDVAAEGRNDAFSGSVSRVLNGGDVVEVTPDGIDTTWRVKSDRVTVTELVDGGTKVQPEAESEDVAEDSPPETGPQLDFQNLTDDDFELFEAAVTGKPLPTKVKGTGKAAAKPKAPSGSSRPGKATSKAARNSIGKVLAAAEQIKSQAAAVASKDGKWTGKQKKDIESAWSTLRLHAEKLGIAAPSVGTFFNAGRFAEAANEVVGQLPEIVEAAPRPTKPKSDATRPERRFEKKAREIDADIESDLAELADILKTEAFSSLTVVNPKVAALVVKIGWKKIRKGMFQFADYVNVFVEYFGRDDTLKLGQYLEEGWERLRALDKNGDLSPVTPVAELLKGATDEIADEVDRDAPVREPTGMVDGVGTPGADEAGRSEGSDAESEPTGEDPGRSDETVRDGDGTDREGDGADGRERDSGDSSKPDDHADGRPDVRRPPAKSRRVATSATLPRIGGEDAGENHRIDTATFTIPKSAGPKIKANIAAIRLLQTIESENRAATPAEKLVLQQYVGWGALPNVFDRERGEIMTGDRTPWWKSGIYEGTHYPAPAGVEEAQKNWERNYGEAYRVVRELLTDDEWLQARDSTINAHYTASDVVAPMWALAERLGFKGGKALELGAGIGHFIGMAPGHLAAKTGWAAVEMDRTSARILKLLYPDAEVVNADLNDVKLVPNSVKLVIGNFPFFEGEQADAPRRYGKPLNLHNYFFARALDALEPGGLLVVISTHATMDNRAEDRMFIGERAELVGAIRLPNDAFKENAGTEVTTDIIMLRKPGGGPAIEKNNWSLLEKVPVDERDAEGEKMAASVNEYFAAHPEMVLGKHSLAGKMRGKPGEGGKWEYTLLPTSAESLEKQIAGVEWMLPSNIITTEDSGTAESVVGVEEVKPGEGSIDVVSGVPSIWLDGAYRKIGPGFDVPDGWPKALKDSTIVERAKAYVGVRNAYRNLFEAMKDEATTDDEIADLQSELSDLFDAYIAEHGHIDQAKTKPFRRDPGYFFVASLEDAKRRFDPETKKIVTDYSKAAVFTTRTIAPSKAPMSADTVGDALVVSLAYRGKIDLGYMATLMGKTSDEIAEMLVAEKLAFVNPKTGLHEIKDVYLTGNVRAKLMEAEIAAEDDPSFTANVEALREAQPDKLEYDEINYRLGGTWIPQHVIQDFVRNLLEDPTATVTYDAAADEWNVTGNKHSTLAVEKYGVSKEEIWSDGSRSYTAVKDALSIIETMLNLKGQRVTKPEHYVKENGDPGTRYVTDDQRSLEAKVHARTIQNEFYDYVKSNESVQSELAEAFNEHFNTNVERKYDGSHLALPGKSSEIKLWSYQKDAIWRFLQERRVLLAHAVGSGKTYSMIAMAMEARRLGIANRPMIVVQNATLGQFATSFVRLYPGANVLVASARDLAKENRKAFMARVISGNWDAIVLAQSTFDGLSVDAETERRFINEQLLALEESAYDDSHSKGKTSTKTKDIVKAQKKLKERLKNATAEHKKKENLVKFNELGIDLLMIDEAHAYKKPPFQTKLEKLVGLSTEFSDRGFSAMMKIRTVQEKAGGRNVVLATGTPITNTLGEAWHMTNYIAPDTLEEFGVDTFDRFAGSFALQDTVRVMNAGGKFVMKEALKRFQNIRLLQTMLRESWDVLSTKQLMEHRIKMGDKMPKLSGGAVQSVIIERTPNASRFADYITSVYDKYMAMEPKYRREMSYIPAVLYAAAKRASLDMRLLYPEYPAEDGGKIEKCVEIAMDEYRRSSEIKGTQMIFSDSFNPMNMKTLDDFMGEEQFEMEFDEEDKKSEADKTEDERISESESLVFGDIKRRLIAAGVPEEQIAIVAQFKTNAAREALWDRVNSGDVRFLLGSSTRMGVGVNAQERMVALHHLDAPWMPADLEQRDGRILRFGNINETVTIYRYAMKGTLDQAIYGSITRKAKFIWEVLSGEFTGNEIDDPASEDIMSLEQMQALSSDNPDFMEEMELTHKLREMEMERVGHENGRARARERLAESTERLENYESHLLPSSQRLYDAVKATVDAEGETEVGGKKFSGNTKAMRDALNETIEAQKVKVGTETKKYLEAKDRIKAEREEAKREKKTLPRNHGKVTVGIEPQSYWAKGRARNAEISGTEDNIQWIKVLGFDVRVLVGLDRQIHKNADGTESTRETLDVVFHVFLPGKNESLYDGNASTGTGLLNAISKLPDGLKAAVDRNQERIKELQGDVETYRGLAYADWEGQEELDRTRDRINELQARTLARSAAEQEAGIARRKAKDAEAKQRLAQESGEETDEAEQEEDEDYDEDFDELSPYMSETRRPRRKPKPEENPVDPAMPDFDSTAEGPEIPGRFDESGMPIRFQPMPVVEMVSLAKDLLGDAPAVKKLREYLGYFAGSRAGLGKIVISALAARDETLLAKVLSHEIGHVFDWLHGHRLDRGNILGRLASLVDYRETILPGEPGGPGALTKEDRKALKREAEILASEGGARWAGSDAEKILKLTPKQILEVWDASVSDPNVPAPVLDYLSRMSEAEKVTVVKQAIRGRLASKLRIKIKTMSKEAVRKAVKEEYAAAILEEVRKRNLLENEKIRDELIRLSEWWTPYDKSNAKYRKYREKSRELYADALSVMLNAPHEVATRAPMFFRGFANYLERKAGELESFFELQDMLNGEPEELSAARRISREQMYAAADEKILSINAARLAARGSMWFKVGQMMRQAVLQRNAPLEDRIKDVNARLRKSKQGRDDETESLYYALQELAHVNGPIAVFLRKANEAIKPLYDAGISDTDLGDWLLFHRIQFDEDRKVLANPQGYTPSTAAQELDWLKNRLGPERAKLAEAGLRKWREAVWEIVEQAGEAGVYGEEKVDELRKNRDAYAAFQVVKYFEGRVSPAIHKQVGTFEDIANPFHATTMKMIALIRWTELNNAKGKLVEFMQKWYGDEISRVAVPYKAKEPNKTPKPGFGFLSIMEDGKTVWYEVPIEVVSSFKSHDVGMLANAGRMMSSVTYGVFHKLYVAYSLSFLAANPVRDIRRTWRNLGAVGSGLQKEHYKALRAAGVSRAEADRRSAKQGITLGSLAWALLRSVPTATRSAFGMNDATMEEMLTNKAFTTPFYQIDPDTVSEGGYTERALQQYGITPHKPSGWIGKALKKVPGSGVVSAAMDTRPMRKLTKMAGYANVLGHVGAAMRWGGSFQETLTKTAGWKLMKERGIEPHRAAAVVRRYVGTPDFKQSGLATVLTNSLSMYWNVRLQGLHADWELATGTSPVVSGTRFGYAWRTLFDSILPTSLQKAALYGAFGYGAALILRAAGADPDDEEKVVDFAKEKEDGFRHLSTYKLDRADNWPLGIVEVSPGRYKAALVSIPDDDVGQLVRSMFSATVDAMIESSGERTRRGSVPKALADIVGTSIGTVWPQDSPLIGVSGAWMDYASDVNPINRFTGRPIVPDLEWAARHSMPGPARAKMLAWTLSQMGDAGSIASMVIGGRVSSPHESGEQTTIEKVASLPGIKRFITITDAGISQDAWLDFANEEANRAAMRLSLPDVTRTLTGRRSKYNTLGDGRLNEREKQERIVLNSWYTRDYLPGYEAVMDATSKDNDAMAERVRAELRTAGEPLKKLDLNRVPERYLAAPLWKLTETTILPPAKKDVKIGQYTSEPREWKVQAVLETDESALLKRQNKSFNQWLSILQAEAKRRNESLSSLRVERLRTWYANRNTKPLKRS